MPGVGAVVFLADGFEEVEAVTPIDFLRRAGVDVTVAGVGTREPTGARGITIRADVRADEVSELPDAVVLPGAMPGAVNLSESDAVRNLTVKVHNAGGLVGSLCAAPAVALGAFGLLDGRRFTCYPGFEEHVSSGTFLEDRVVRDGNLITSRGPGTAAEFAIELVRYLTGDDQADALHKGTIQK